MKRRLFFGPAESGFQERDTAYFKPGGRLAVVEIVKSDTLFGQPFTKRHSPEDLKSALGLFQLVTVSVGEYLYMQLFENR